ncbi:TPA: hypothetical protein U1B45_001636 [Streptococcus suis]|nr:hypothetical protein [Streptococcus suis]
MLEELKVLDKVEVRHPMFNKTYEGVIINVNHYRPPEEQYAVQIEFLGDYLFLGRENLTKI